ncbi:MAG: leucine-rich repeat protein, partial [Fastidiosipila sp.]|nr:leucine-rich repeat protein [Fastidiosipila sp.]
IEDDAFWISTALNNVVLPGTLKKIGNNAFRNCDELTSIIIPEGVKEIGDEVFSSSRKLKDIYVPASVTEFGTYAFDTFCPDMVIHLVKGSVAESYCKDNEWKYDYKTVQRTVFSVEGVADDLQDDTAIVYKISDEVKFILPPDITFEHDVDEEGSESYKILSGKYKDDEENTQYEYRVSVSISSSKDDDSSPQTIIKNISESSGILKLMGSRPAVFTSPPLGDMKTLSFFGQTMTVVAINLFVWTDLGDRVNLLSFDTIIGDIGEKIGPICENLIRVSQTLRVNGEPLDLTNVSVDSMRKKLQLVPSDGDGVANVEPLFFDALEKSDLDSELKDTLTETPEKPKHVGKATELWLDKYCEYVESNPEIEINGKKFVFSGLTTRSQEKNHRIVNKLTFHGGQHRLSVSSVTDYLVVNPDKASESEIKSVIEQRDKGKQIKVILLEDLEKALEVKSSKLTGHDYAGVPSYYVAATDDDFIEDEDGETFRYIGNHEYVIIPYVINGKEITSYRRMFEEAYSLEGIYRTNLKGVASLNTNVTDMSGMFDG